MNDLIKPGAVFNRYRESIGNSTYSNKEGQSFGKPYGSGNVGDSTYGGQWTNWCDAETPSKSSLSVTGTEIWGKKPEMNGADGENDWNLHADLPKPSNCIPRPLHASFKSNDDDVYSLLLSTSGENDASSLGKGATNMIWNSNGYVSQAKEIRDLFDPAKCDKNTVDLMEQFGLLNVRDERIGATNLTGNENQNQGSGWNNFPSRSATRGLGIGEDLGLECWQAKVSDGQKLSIDEEKNISLKRLESGLIGQRRDSNVSSEGSGCGKIDRRDVWDRQDSWSSGKRNEDNWKNSWECPDQAMPPVPFPNSNTGTEVWNKTENHPLMSPYPKLPVDFNPSVPPPPLPGVHMPPQLNPSAISNVDKLQSILNSCPLIRSKSIHDVDLSTNSDSQWSASNPGTMSWNGSHPGQPWSSTGKSNENLNTQTLYRCIGQAMMSGRSSHPPHSQTQTRSRWIQELASMGFKKEDAQRALINSNMDFECALGELVFMTGHAADLLKLNSYQQQQPIHQQQRQPQFDSCRDVPRTAALLAGSQPVGGPSLSPTQLAEFVKLLSNPVGAYIRDQAISPNFSNQMSKSPFSSNLLSSNPRLPTLSGFGSPMLSGFGAPSLPGFGPPTLPMNDADPIQLALDRLSLAQNQPPSAELMKELLKLTEQPNPHADLARPSSLLGGESISRQSVSGGSSPMIYGLPNDLPFGNVSTDGIPSFTNDIASYTDGIRSFTLPDGSVFRMPDRNSANSSLLSPSANKQSPRSTAMMAPFGQASGDLAAYVGGLQSSNRAPKSSSLKIKEFIPGIPWQGSTTRDGAENRAGGGISPLNASNSPKPDDIKSSSNVGEAGYYTSTSESEVSSLPSLSTNWIEIKNVPSQFDVESLKSLCVLYGALKSFTFQASKGTVLVGYAEREDAIVAQQALDCYMVDGVQISVNFVMDWHVAASHSEKKLPSADSTPQMGYMTPGGLWIPPADTQPEDFNDQAEPEEGWNEDGIYDENYTCEGWDLQAELPVDEPEGGYFSPVENPDKSA